MEETMIKNLKTQTGKSLEQWITLVKKARLGKHGEIVKWLKTEHGFTHGYANLVAHKARGSDAGSAGNTQDLVDNQYSGPKADLRPVYDKIIEYVRAFGSDVEVSPKKAYVSLRRNKQFALIQPSTKTRIDVGINLGDEPPSGKLEISGSFNSMVSHRVRVGGVEEVDQSLVDWLRQAYDRAG